MNCFINFPFPGINIPPVEMSHDQLDTFIEKNRSKDHFGQNWTCNICGHLAINKLDIGRHIEAKHVIVPILECDYCQKPHRTRDALRRHVMKVHN